MATGIRCTDHATLILKSRHQLRRPRRSVGRYIGLRTKSHSLFYVLLSIMYKGRLLVFTICVCYSWERAFRQCLSSRLVMLRVVMLTLAHPALV
jgi:hypothetical protein